jgi:hypothetical protein
MSTTQQFRPVVPMAAGWGASGDEGRLGGINMVQVMQASAIDSVRN